MSKKLISIIVLAAICFGSFSQQIPLRSQYMMDLSMLNPAVAGIYEFTPINLSYRQQWVGFDGAPVTQSLNGHKYLGKNVGMGIGFFNELATPTRRTGVQVTFAYHLRLSEDYTRKLSFGFTPVFFQHYINTELLTTDEPNDPTIMGGFNNQFCPDANFGIMLSRQNRYYLGVSVFNLLQIRRDLFAVMDEIDSPVERTFYGLAGVTIRAGDNFSVEPSAMVQHQLNTPFQFDANLKAMYKNHFGLGFSYRHMDAYVCMVFIGFNNYRIGYSYDITMSDMSRYSYGSHEFHLSYLIYRDKKTEHRHTQLPMFY